MNQPGRSFRRAPPDDGGMDSWILTYSDAITLLMAFFVMMFSISKVDKDKMERLKDAIESEIGHRDTLERRSDELHPTPSAQPGVVVKAEDVLQPLQVDGLVAVTQSPKGITIEVPASVLFGSGGTTLTPGARKILAQVGWTLQLTEYRYGTINVEGHTDDTPAGGGTTNWDISSQRATEVVEFFESQGIEPERLGAVGYGSTRPKADNRDGTGMALPDAQALNRRVAIRVEWE